MWWRAGCTWSFTLIFCCIYVVLKSGLDRYTQIIDNYFLLPGSPQNCGVVLPSCYAWLTVFLYREIVDCSYHCRLNGGGFNIYRAEEAGFLWSVQWWSSDWLFVFGRHESYFLVISLLAYSLFRYQSRYLGISERKHGHKCNTTLPHISWQTILSLFSIYRTTCHLGGSLVLFWRRLLVC